MFSKEEAKELRIAFWNGFKRYSAPKRRAKELQGKWLGNRTSIKAVQLKFDIDRERAIVGIDIFSLDLDKHQFYYHKFVSLKNLLDSEVEGLVWEDLYEIEEGKEISRIYKQLNGVDIYNKECWKEVYAFFTTTMIPIELFFLEYKEFIKDPNAG